MYGLFVHGTVSSISNCPVPYFLEEDRPRSHETECHSGHVFLDFSE
jgi:hypothetical protein